MTPQLENGYLRIANELQEAFARTRISGEARQVLDVIIRQTYGYNKKEDKISLSQFSLMTGMKKPTICKAIKKLCLMNITKKDNGNISKYSVNKHFDTWKPLPKKITVAKGVTFLGNKVLPKKIHTKDNIQKTITTTTPLQLQENNFPISIVNENKVSKKDYTKFENEAFKTWNMLADKCHLAPLMVIKGRRKTHLQSRYADKDFVANWIKLLYEVELSKFLRGGNENKWAVTFDWLTKNDNNYCKVLEGQYRDKNVDNLWITSKKKNKCAYCQTEIEFGVVCEKCKKDKHG